MDVLITTNGRDELLHEGLRSLARHLDDRARLFVVDDSVAQAVSARDVAKSSGVAGSRVAVLRTGGNAGQPTAVRTGHGAVAADGAATFLHWEDDFVITDHESFARMLTAAWRTLTDVGPGRNVCQVAAVRQPWYPNEVAAGGVLKAREVQGGAFFNVGLGSGLLWHRDHVTLNPSVWSVRAITQVPYPQTIWAESRWGQELFSAGWRAAYWGRAPIVEHLGTYRLGVRY